MNYFLCVVLFLLAAASNSVAGELIRATYDGYYDYAIVCKDKKWKERNTKLCSKRYSMVSAFEFNGNSLSGTFTAEDSSGSHYTGEYDFSKFSFTDKKSKADAVWRDKWGYGKVNLKTTDNWETFDGEWFYFSNGEQSIRGHWRGKLVTSYSQVSPIMAFASKDSTQVASASTKAEKPAASMNLSQSSIGVLSWSCGRSFNWDWVNWRLDFEKRELRYEFQLRDGNSGNGKASVTEIKNGYVVVQDYVEGKGWENWNFNYTSNNLTSLHNGELFNYGDCKKALYASEGNCNSQSTECLVINDFEINVTNKYLVNNQHINLFFSDDEKFRCPFGYSIGQEAGFVLEGEGSVSVCTTDDYDIINRYEADASRLSLFSGNNCPPNSKHLFSSSDNNPDTDDLIACQQNTKIDFAERQKIAQLEKELSALKIQNLGSQQSASADNIVPLISITNSSTIGPSGTIEGRVTDNEGVGEVRIDGKLASLDASGNFTASTYVPEGGISVLVEAFDLAGLSSSMTVRLDRSASIANTTISFDRLNPLGRKVAKNRDAIALIVGVDNYERTPARAIFADSDAKVFADYASEKLGIPGNRIKTLVNDGADEQGMLLAVKKWLSRLVKQGDTDVYVFFAGHGLTSDDGKQMYLLPYDGSPELLDDTAIARERLFNDIASAKPRSVTVFLDTCYSGTTRGTDVLITSRPITLKVLKQSLPDNFTVMTAAAGDQTAKPLEEAKHGMFSYFLMKGMEGDADTNQDNQITAGELHQYVQTNVVQQSSGSQTPELQGDADRVLVQFQ
ncbi:caspase family protein [Alphaproteobacteria bacterium]|nr:caspase family protein [Alphaproteobacteria bacterium]